MAAISYPQPSFPGLDQLRARPRRVRPVAVPRPLAPVRPRRSTTQPTAATYRRRQAVALVLVLALAGTAWLAASAAIGVVGAAVTAEAPVASPQALAAAPIASRPYVVQSGDTLWSIARRLQPEGDVRPLVAELAHRNGGSALQAGERLDLDGLGR